MHVKQLISLKDKTCTLGLNRLGAGLKLSNKFLDGSFILVLGKLKQRSSMILRMLNDPILNFAVIFVEFVDVSRVCIYFSLI